MPLKSTAMHYASGMARSLPRIASRNLLRRYLRNRDFTIVSNNCWGAHIYQKLGIEYRTPFIGLFFAPDCYLRLLSRLRWYLDQPLHFLDSSRHAYVNVIREENGLTYPIGSPGDEIEIQFLHYSSRSEANEKWRRRVARMVEDDNRVFAKFCDRDGCSREQLLAFDRMPLIHKVCFVSRPMPQLAHGIFIPGCDAPYVPNGLILSQISWQYFDAASWINGSDGCPRWSSFLHGV